MCRNEIIWLMPFVVGIRIQNAYIARNSQDDEKDKKPLADMDMNKFVAKEQEILRQYLPDDYFNGKWDLSKEIK